MKKHLVLLFVISFFWSCKNKEEQQKMANLKNQDSLLSVQNQSQDSTITSYIRAFNDIEDNMDSIKMRQHIISVTSASGETPDKKTLIISDMRDIEAMMNKNRQALAAMKRKLNKENGENAELKKMIAHLTEELAEKDSDIASLQKQLSESIANYGDLMKRFNDSLGVITQKNAQITSQNVVYYAVGTTKELKNKGVIMKQGGVLGVGGTEELKPNTNTQYFTAVDMNRITCIPLYSKFDKLVTSHPASSYNIRGNKKTDSLFITDSKSFWSESKYLVIIVKQK